MDQTVRHLRAVQPFAVWQGGFNAAELDAIIAFGEKLKHEKATIYGETRESSYENIRVTRTAWIDNRPETHWIYDKLFRIAYHLNEKFYRLDITEMSEQLQYTVYETAEGGHYDWHVDHSTVTPVPRKLSLVLQLSEPTAYEGCDLQLHSSSAIETAPRERGTVILFPSYGLHRVSPITAGRRVSLVSWISGPFLR